MLKKFAATFVIALMIPQGASAQDSYDPLHTMLALNMAIVSVNRIITTQDRAVLEWEYENIINRLAIGNIESDPEMKSLYDELLGFINGKRLRQEDLIRLKDSYKRREQEAYYRAMSKGFESFKSPENNPTQKTLWGWIGNLFVSGASSVGAGYYDYQASKEELHREIKSDEWQLTKDELNAGNKLQATLLNSSWSLLSKYHLPNEYRLTQENVREFLSAMNEADPSNRLGRLRFIERKFRVYPPYWFFRAYAAKGAGNEAECRKCFSRFNEVWRPVLNYDPYKLEATKYRIRELAEKGVQSDESLAEIRRLVEVVRDYTPAYDWGSNLFAWIVYFALGDKDEAITCVEYGNVKPGRETEISGAVLAFMKRETDISAMPPEVIELYGKILAILPHEELVKEAERGNAAAQYALGEKYHEGRGVKEDDSEALKWFRKAAEQGHAEAQNSLGFMYRNGYGVKQDYSEAVKWFRMAAEQGLAEAQNNLGWMYQNGYGVKQDYTEAVKWFRKAAEQGLAEAQNNLGWMYQNGYGVKQDYAEALKWYRKSAEQGDAAAQNNLGFMYRNGYGVKQDYSEAVKWYRMAAEQGLAEAQYNLGLKYENGKGVPKDLNEARKWYQKAAEQGDEDAKSALERLK